MSDTFRAEPRMLFDQRAFIGRQTTGLFQNILRDGEDSDVVDEPRQRQAMQILPIVAKADAELRC